MDNPAKTLGFPERVALYGCASQKSELPARLDRLAGAERAQEFAEQVLKWDSPTRQARLSREFGSRGGALEGLRALIVEAPPGLRVAIAEQLPPTWRAHFAHLKARSPIAPALANLASRLIREATR